MSRVEIPRPVRQALAELKESLAGVYGDRLKGVFLYGSYARGDYHDESDVDVLIVLRGPVKVSEEIHRYGAVVSDICLRYNLLISTLPIAEEMFRDGPRSFFEPVQREAVQL